MEHVAYHYNQQEVYLINHSLDRRGLRTVDIELIGPNGETIGQRRVLTSTAPNTSKSIATVPGVDKIKDVAFLRLMLRDGEETLSRNVYWLSATLDELNWDKSTWYQ